MQTYAQFSEISDILRDSNLSRSSKNVHIGLGFNFDNIEGKKKVLEPRKITSFWKKKLQIKLNSEFVTS